MRRRPSGVGLGRGGRRGGLGCAGLGRGDLGGARFGCTWLGGAWLGGAWFGGAWFGCTWLGGAWFGGAWFGGAWFGCTWLGGAWFGGAWFGCTWLGGAWLGGAWLGGAWFGGTSRRAAAARARVRCGGLRPSVRYGDVSLLTRGDRQESDFCLGRAEPPAGLAHPGLGVRLGCRPSPNRAHWRLGSCLRLGIRPSNAPLGTELADTRLSLGRAVLAVGSASLGRAVLAVGPGSLGRHARIGRFWLRVSIPGDVHAAAGADARILGE